MTLPELLTLLTCLMIRPCPKQGKKQKKTRKRIGKGPFRVKDNPLKQYKPHSPDYVATAHARARDRLLNATVAEDRADEILRSMGLAGDYKREYVWFYPGKYAIFDFIFLRHKVILEIDGSVHDEPSQKRHDEGRDKYFKSLGFQVVRVSNGIVMRNRYQFEKIIREALRIKVN